MTRMSTGALGRLELEPELFLKGVNIDGPAAHRTSAASDGPCQDRSSGNSDSLSRDQFDRIPDDPLTSIVCRSIWHGLVPGEHLGEFIELCTPLGFHCGRSIAIGPCNERLLSGSCDDPRLATSFLKCNFGPPLATRQRVHRKLSLVSRWIFELESIRQAAPEASGHAIIFTLTDCAFRRWH